MTSAQLGRHAATRSDRARSRPRFSCKDTQMQLQHRASQPQPRSDRPIESTPAALRRVLLILALTLGLAACAATPPSVPRAPQPLQVDTARLNEVVDWLKADVAKNRYPGAA